MGFMAKPVAAGDFNTYIKYDARAGRWYTKPDGGGELYEVENMTAAVDFEAIQTGWFQYVEGQAPIKVFDPSLTEPAPRPSPEAKRGFEVMLFSKDNIGGLREFSSTAAAVIDAMNAAYDEWEAGKAKHPGKIAVLKCNGVQGVKSSKSTNYRPSLAVVGWADRPAAFDEGADNATTPEPAKAPPKAAALAPVLEDDDVAF